MNSKLVEHTNKILLMVFEHQKAKIFTISALLFLSIFFSFLLISCSPSYSLNDWTVKPEYVCVPGEIHVTWNISGAIGKVRLEPIGGTVYESTETATGNESYAINGDTYVRLIINGTEVRSKKILTIPPEGEQYIFTATGECVSNGVARWAVVNPPDIFDDRLVVQEVINHTPRSITVEHNGTIVSLPSFGSSTSEFHGPPTGDWNLNTTILPGETQWCQSGTIEGGSGSPPPSLSIEIRMTCGGI